MCHKPEIHVEGGQGGAGPVAGNSEPEGSEVWMAAATADAPAGL